LISTTCLARVNNCNLFSKMSNRESYSAANCECAFLMNTLSVVVVVAVVGGGGGFFGGG